MTTDPKYRGNFKPVKGCAGDGKPNSAPKMSSAFKNIPHNGNSQNLCRTSVEGLKTIL